MVNAKYDVKYIITIEIQLKRQGLLEYPLLFSTHEILLHTDFI